MRFKSKEERMNKQRRNLLIVFAAFGIVVLVLATCAAPAGPALPGSSTGAPIASPPAGFQITDLRMTNSTDCNSPATTIFSRNQSIYISWQEIGRRPSGVNVNLIIRMNPSVSAYPTIPHIPTPGPTPLTNRCEHYPFTSDLRATLQLGPGSYQTSVDAKYVPTVTWTIQ